MSRAIPLLPLWALLGLLYGDLYLYARLRKPRMQTLSVSYYFAIKMYRGSGGKSPYILDYYYSKVAGSVLTLWRTK
jgi:hypothetical protein